MENLLVYWKPDRGEEALEEVLNQPSKTLHAVLLHR
jgi:hypothetical protein